MAYRPDTASPVSAAEASLDTAVLIRHVPCMTAAAQAGTTHMAEAGYYPVLHTRSCWFLSRVPPASQERAPPVIPRMLPSVCEPPTATSLLLKASTSPHGPMGSNAVTAAPLTVSCGRPNKT